MVSRADPRLVVVGAVDASRPRLLGAAADFSPLSPSSNSSASSSLSLSLSLPLPLSSAFLFPFLAGLSLFHPSFDALTVPPELLLVS